MNFPPPTERQARLIWLGLTGLAVAVLLGLLAALIWGLNELLRLLSPVLWPIAVAGVLGSDWSQRPYLAALPARPCREHNLV